MKRLYSDLHHTTGSYYGTVLLLSIIGTILGYALLGLTEIDELPRIVIALAGGIFATPFLLFLASFYVLFMLMFIATPFIIVYILMFILLTPRKRIEEIAVEQQAAASQTIHDVGQKLSDLYGASPTKGVSQFAATATVGNVRFAHKFMANGVDIAWMNYGGLSIMQMRSGRSLPEFMIDTVTNDGIFPQPDTESMGMEKYDLGSDFGAYVLVYCRPDNARDMYQLMHPGLMLDSIGLLREADVLSMGGYVEFVFASPHSAAHIVQRVDELTAFFGHLERSGRGIQSLMSRVLVVQQGAKSLEKVANRYYLAMTGLFALGCLSTAIALNFTEYEQATLFSMAAVPLIPAALCFTGVFVCMGMVMYAVFIDTVVGSICKLIVKVKIFNRKRKFRMIVRKYGY